jgi:hypothetical protein
MPMKYSENAVKYCKLIKLDKFKNSFFSTYYILKENYSLNKDLKFRDNCLNNDCSTICSDTKLFVNVTTPIKINNKISPEIKKCKT